MSVTPSPLKRRGTKHLSPEIRQSQLIDAAIRCFGKFGYHGTTMDQVVTESGLSKGSLYRFFKSKEDLLIALVDKWLDESRRKLEIDSDLNPLDALRDYCLLNIEKFSKNIDLQNIWLEFIRHEVVRVQLQSVYKTDRKYMARILRVANKKGLIRISSAQEAANTLLTLLEGTLLIAAIESDKNIEKRFKATWKMYVASLNPQN